MKPDIQHIEDVKYLVDEFYKRVRQDDLLAPVFNEVLENRWPEHLEKMVSFWQTILLGEHTYQGYPFRPHAQLPVNKKHFDQWIELFYQTLDEKFEGENAFAAKRQASKMSALFQMKLNQISKIQQEE